MSTQELDAAIEAINGQAPWDAWYARQLRRDASWTGRPNVDTEDPLRETFGLAYGGYGEDED